MYQISKTNSQNHEQQNLNKNKRTIGHIIHLNNSSCIYFEILKYKTFYSIVKLKEKKHSCSGELTNETAETEINDTLP